MRFVRLALFVAASTSLTVVARAQSGPAPKTTVISIQPLSAVFNVYAAEAEHAVSPTWTVGVGTSYWNHDEDDFSLRYISGDVKLKYYPDATPFKGFSFGGQVGYTSIKEGDAFDPSASNETTVSGPTLGVALDYNWLLGPPQTFYVGLGVGAKKIFAKAEDAGHATVNYPTARISIGFAF
jgi:hypothetical protein